METKREREALFALELIYNINKDKKYLSTEDLLGQLKEAIDMIYDKPKASEEETPELLLGTYEYPVEEEE